MRRGWWRVFRLGSPERDVAEEFAFHRERTVEDLMAEGHGREEAEAEARRRFGDEDRWRQEVEAVDRGMARRRRLRDVAAVSWETLRSAARRVARRPGLAVGIALTFALGVGANSVMFGVTDRVLLSPPDHVAQPDRVKRLMTERFHRWANRTETSDGWAYTDFRALKDAETLQSVAAYAARETVVGRGPAAEEVPAVLVTGDYFSTLGVTAAAGRLLGPGDDVRDGARRAVLGYGYWQRRYGGDPSAIGARIEVAGSDYTVVGVAPRGFNGIELERVDLWLPLNVAGVPGLDGWRDNPYFYWIKAVGRLAPGTTVPRAEAEATLLHRRGRQAMIEAGDYDPEARVVAAPLIAAQGPLASDEARVVKWLTGVSLLVLLIAGFNVANLLLARTSERRREVGVRMALGISHPRLAGEMLAEGALLGLLGAAAALAMAVAGGGALRRALLPDVAWAAPLNPRLVVFTVALAVVAGVASTALPVVQAVRGRAGDALRGFRSGTGRGGRTRAALTAGQAALSVVLLAGAGLFVRSLHQVHSQELGVVTERLVVVRAVGSDGLPTPERRRLYEDAERRLDRIPGVESVTLSGWSRFFSGLVMMNLRVPGRDSLPELRGRTPAAALVRPDYLETTGLRLAAGRWIRDGDVLGSTPVVVVNRAMADLLFGGRAVGECFHVEDGPCRQVVGVVETAKQRSPTEQPRPQYYVPMAQQERYPPQAAYVRLARGADGATLNAVRSAVFEASPTVRYVDVQRLDDLIAPFTRPWRLGATLFSAFGLLALLVAGVGLYSLLAYEVARRMPELGIRAALGATAGRMGRAVVIRSVRVVGVGLALGLLAAWFLAPRVGDLLFETPPRDAVTLGTVTFTLLLLSVVAAGVPAFRAGRADPNEALRAE